jgi:ParB-like chromosome segregation protein Spo0J
MIKLVPVSSLKENPDNPRKITTEKLASLVKSIRDFPEMLNLRPLVIDDDNVVLGGNMRLKAIRELGIESVPVVRADSLTERQKKEFVIRDNVSAGTWDNEALESWEEADLEEWGAGQYKYEGFDGNIDEMFEEHGQEKEKKQKTVLCPHCGENIIL